MADTYEKDLAQKSSLTTSDYIRVVGSDNVSYKQGLSSVKTALGINDIITTTTFSGTSSSSGNLQITLPSTSYRPILAYSTASDSQPTWFEIASFAGNWYVRAFNNNGVLTNTSLSGTVVWAKIS